MYAKITIKDVETNEILEDLGNITYSNAGKALQNCEEWYSEKIEAWTERNYNVEIVLIDINK